MAQQPRGPRITYEPSDKDFVGPLERRFYDYIQNGVANVMQVIQPTQFLLPPLQSSVGLSDKDFGLPEKKSGEPSSNAISMSYPQAMQSMQHAVVNRYRDIEIVGDTLDVYSHELVCPNENTVLNMVILSTRRTITHVELWIGETASSEVRLSTMWWPRKTDPLPGRSGKLGLCNYNIMGALGGISISPQQLKFRICVHFSCKNHCPLFGSYVDLPISQGRLHIASQVLPMRTIPIRSGYLLSKGADSLAVSEFAKAEVQSKGQFQNILPRGLGFKCSTHEPVELDMSNPRMWKWSVPAEQKGRQFSMFWLVLPEELAENVESFSFLGSTVHSDLAIDNKTAPMTGFKSFYFNFSATAMSTQDAGTGALVAVEAGDLLTISFCEDTAIEAQRIGAYVMWYDLYALRDHKARRLTPGQPAK